MRRAQSRMVIFGVIATLLVVCMALVSCGEARDQSHNVATSKLVGRTSKVVALTFDDGPDPRFTPEVLKTLKKEGIKATFFMIGSNVDTYPAVAREVKEAGCQIENHTYSHPNLEQLTVDQIKQEIGKCQDTILRVTGVKTHYFRPPKGWFDSRTVEATQETGYKIVLWNVTVEHKAATTSTDEANRVLGLTKPEYIILAHDGRLNREKTVEALPSLIEGLKARGYRFVTIDELAKIAPSLVDEKRGKRHPQAVGSRVSTSILKMDVIGL